MRVLFSSLVFRTKRGGLWQRFAQLSFDSLAKVLFVLLIILLGSWLWKPLASLYYQQQAGTQLMQVLPVGENDYGGFACLHPMIEDYEQREALKVALAHLHKAQEISPNASHSYYLLGKTLCLLGDYESAIEAFERFAQFRPKNPLGYLEMGFALLQSCPPNGKCADGLNTYDAWRTGGIKAEDFIVMGQYARSKMDFEGAIF